MGPQYPKVVVVLGLRLRTVSNLGSPALTPSLNKHKSWAAAPRATPPTTQLTREQTNPEPVFGDLPPCGSRWAELPMSPS